MLQDTLMSHGRTRSNQSNHLLPNTTENGVFSKKEIDLKSDTDSPSSNPSVSYKIMLVWFKDIERDGGAPEAITTIEDGKTAE